jgi:hypothetical protein
VGGRSGPTDLTSPIHHFGILVADLDTSIEELSSSLGLTFRPPLIVPSVRIDPAEFGDEHPHPSSGRLTFSIEGPPYIELSQAHGSGIHSISRYGAGLHHVGIFPGDLMEGIGVIETDNPGSLGAILSPDGRMLGWYSRPSPATGVIVELLDDALHEPIDRFITLGEASG